MPTAPRAVPAGVSAAGIWILSLSVAWTGLVSSPTRVWTPLWEQTEPAVGRSLGGLLIDQESADHFAAVAAAVDANWPGDGPPLLLGFSDLQGAVVYSDATSVSGGWYSAFLPGRTVSTLERACARPEWRNRERDPLILVRDFNLVDEFVTALTASCDVDFPAGYSAIETFEQPMGYYPFSERVTLWVPTTGGQR